MESYKGVDKNMKNISIKTGKLTPQQRQDRQLF